MRIKNSIFIILVYLLLFNAMSFSQNKQPGVEAPEFSRVASTGWQFLKIPTTARNAALADIKSGLINNDASAVFSNPARLVDVENIEVSLSNISYVADISYITASVAKNFGNIGTFGVFVANLDVGDMVRTENLVTADFSGRQITERSGPLGTVTAGDLQIGLSYSRYVTDRLSIGGNVSYMEETLDDVNVSNVSIDFGVHFHTGFKSLRFAILGRNYSPDKRFVGFSELYGLPQLVRSPLDFRFGIGYDILESTNTNPHLLSTYLEFDHPNDGPEKVHTAIEYSYMGFADLRGGYKFNYDEQGLTFGGGLNLDLGGIMWQVDYAYVDYGRLSTVHLFTLGFAFN